MKIWISVILATIAIMLGGCQPEAGVPNAKAQTINSTDPAPQAEPALLPTDTSNEVASGVNEDYNDPNDPDYEPRTTVGDEIYEAEQSVPVGKWGAVFAGLQVGTGPSVNDVYKVGYEELEVLPNGTYVWWGWRWGAEFKKSGTWTRAEINDESYLVMEDRAMLFEGEKGIKNVVFESEKRYAKFYKGEDGFYRLEPYIGGVGSMLWGVHYDLKRRGYYDILGDRLEAAK